MNWDTIQVAPREDSGHVGRVMLSSQVKEFIIQAILSGEFEPGTRVVESSLARRLGVSQAPVREAIRELTATGFLEAEPYKGTSVCRFSLQDLQEVYAVRSALEQVAARLAAPRVTEADIACFEGILDEMIDAARRHDLRRMTKLDNKFHETIVQLSGNKMLRRTFHLLLLGYWTTITVRLSKLDLEELAARHKDLLEALKSRDPEPAAAAMQRHIEELGKPSSQLQ
jgi:DNA-binding GntR family transcriptional regulator